VLEKSPTGCVCSNALFGRCSSARIKKPVHNRALKIAGANIPQAIYQAKTPQGWLINGDIYERAKKHAMRSLGKNGDGVLAFYGRFPCRVGLFRKKLTADQRT
jgi:hypothetical protein